MQAVSVRDVTSAGAVRASDTGDRLALYSSVNHDFAQLSIRFRKLEQRLGQVESLLATQSAVPGR